MEPATGGLGAAEIMAISIAVVALTQLVKWAKPAIEGAAALGVVTLLSGIGVALWVFSQPTLPDRTWLFSLFAGWVVVVTTAAGVFGFVRSRSD